MEESHDELRIWIHGRNVRSFLQVAADTAEAKVLGVIGSTVLPPNDVIDLMRQNRRILRKAAVLADPLSALLDQLPHIAGDFHDAARIDQKSSA